ncbi:hypothetical protein [Undibacterium sp.]|uniref:hypothetical protein n=1 Tax=Undibacterium sp. TaxID=1914977 RepID=UPI00374DC65D
MFRRGNSSQFGGFAATVKKAAGGIHADIHPAEAAAGGNNRSHRGMMVGAAELMAKYAFIRDRVLAQGVRMPSTFHAASAGDRL